MRYFILISIFVSGCLGIKTTRKLTKEIRQNFTNRFEGKNTGVTRKLIINGYYRYWLKDQHGSYEKIGNTNDTAFVDIIFYEDGTFIWNVNLRPGLNNYNDYFKSIINNGEKDLFYKSDAWGIYSISSDTIKAQFLRHAARFTPWYTGEEWYLIKDSQTLQVIFFGDIQKTENNTARNNDYIGRTSLANFKPLNNIPPPLGWLKKESFFWRNKNDWKKYMESLD